MSGHGNGILPSLGLLILRLGAGGLLLGGHGWPKLQRFSERLTTFANPIGLGPEVSFSLVVFAEVLCSSLVILGLGTRLAALPIAIFLSVAAFVQHLHDPWAKKELPLLYLAAFLALLIAGGGRFSLDAVLRGRFGTGKRPKR
ncbi:MAG TPA: DoxX family protein [Candidatus Methylomirabilis sp.]|nr:DoxX family protein [Candidatus Methylomirabilis sp.]